MSVVYKSGASGSISVLGATVPITKWDAASKYKDVDTTSSASYDEASETLYETQLKTSLGMEFSFEGFLDVGNSGYNTANTGVLAALKQSNAPVAVVLNYAANAPYASCNADVLSFDVTMTVAGALAYKGSGKSNDVITF